MWVARTIAIAKKDWRKRPLAGQRRVRPWYERYIERPNTAGDRFGMTFDQFRAYRQTGMYGGYRLAFRKWPEMTIRGDGWTPGPAANRLAKWLDARLGKAKPSWRLHVGDGDDGSLSSRSAKRRRGKEYEWWLQNWKAFDEKGKQADGNTLPRVNDDFARLPEASLMKPLVFGGDSAGKRRLAVACEIAKAANVDHSSACEHLGHVFAKSRAISLLPHFSRLADAGMEAMDLLAESLGSKKRVALSTAHRFANAISSTSPKDCLRALLQYHEAYGGGLRWFVLRNGWIEPRTPQRVGSARYRFRLRPLCRLAAQCGAIQDMPSALRQGVESEEDEENSETTDE